jgi:hypothetical protein
MVTCPSFTSFFFFFFVDRESLLWNVVKVWIDVTEITVCVVTVLTEIQFTQQHFLVCVTDTNCNWNFFVGSADAICGWPDTRLCRSDLGILIYKERNPSSDAVRFCSLGMGVRLKKKRILVSTVPNNMQSILSYLYQTTVIYDLKIDGRMM